MPLNQSSWWLDYVRQKMQSMYQTKPKAYNNSHWQCYSWRLLKSSLPLYQGRGAVLSSQGTKRRWSSSGFTCAYSGSHVHDLRTLKTCLESPQNLLMANCLSCPSKSTKTACKRETKRNGWALARRLTGEKEGRQTRGRQSSRMATWSLKWSVSFITKKQPSLGGEGKRGGDGLR